MFDGIITWWAALNTGVQAALIGAGATIASATIGVLVVARQIRTQAANAIRQNKHNEALQLKMKVYEEIIRVCAGCQNAEASLSSFVRGFSSAVEICRKQQAAGHPFTVPRQRFQHFMDLQTSLDKSSIQMISLTERWQIIDPRIEVFRTAFNVAIHNIREASWRYTTAVVSLLPIERVDAPGQLIPWSPPSEQQLNLLNTAGSLIQCRGFQNSLLSGVI